MCSLIYFTPPPSPHPHPHTLTEIAEDTEENDGETVGGDAEEGDGDPKELDSEEDDVDDDGEEYLHELAKQVCLVITSSGCVLVAYRQITVAVAVTYM